MIYLSPQWLSYYLGKEVYTAWIHKGLHQVLDYGWPYRLFSWQTWVYTVVQQSLLQTKWLDQASSLKFSALGKVVSWTLFRWMSKNAVFTWMVQNLMVFSGHSLIKEFQKGRLFPLPLQTILPISAVLTILDRVCSQCKFWELSVRTLRWPVIWYPGKAFRPRGQSGSNRSPTC